ncbi:MAG: hypothetical protein COA74_04285 [Gammaproteobacteria bacterium]|nr:MAG: hypothetical protein COA74_04285 [Gammaproteobacteria bacterium]
MTDTSHDERRDFYRINDTVGLHYTVCDNDIPDAESFAAEIPNEFQLISHLNGIDMDSSTLLHNIQDISPDVSRYFKIINNKIDALARHIVTLGIDDEIKPQAVTLSAGGVCFVCNEKLALDSFVRVSMVLYPSCSGILAYGKVVRCEAMPDTHPQQYDLALEYVLINESDRDSLVRHVLQLQSNYLRQNK